MNTTISGSFRKFYDEICRAYDIFEKNGINVLSPKKSRILNPGGDFAILETDPRELTVRQLENIHLTAISNSDFLYLIDTEGYVGPTASFEMGYAHSLRKPIYASCEPQDILLKQYISGVLTPEDLCKFFQS